MKRRLLSTFNLILIFAFALMLTVSYKVHPYGNGQMMGGKRSSIAVKAEKAFITRENTTEILHSELLFKY